MSIDPKRRRIGSTGVRPRLPSVGTKAAAESGVATNCVSSTDPLLETARKLGEARRILEGVGATSLGGVAQMLAETAESLARTAREPKWISPDEWLTFEEAAAYLKKTPKAFERIVAKGEISSNT